MVTFGLYFYTRLRKGKVKNRNEWRRGWLRKIFSVICRPGLPNLFSVAGHFHRRIFSTGHKRFCDVTISYCDVTNPLILIIFMR